MPRVSVEFMGGRYHVYEDGEFDSDYATYEEALTRFLELSNDYCVVVMETK